MINDQKDSLSSKVSSLEKEGVLEGNDVGDEKTDSRIKVEKEENDVVLVSFQAPCLEKDNDSKDQDVGILKLGKGKDFGPVTAFVNREIIDISSSSDQTEEENAVLGCQTPTQSIFDPFAPGPEDLMLAPEKKMARQGKIPLRRQLDFNSCNDSMDDIEANASEEDQLVELLYESFFDLIVSSEFQEISAEGPKTPTSLPIPTGVAETCPPAPMRLPALKARRLSPDIRRKLEFETKLS